MKLIYLNNIFVAQDFYLNEGAIFIITHLRAFVKHFLKNNSIFFKWNLLKNEMSL